METDKNLILHRVGELERWRDGHELIHEKHEILHKEERENYHLLSEKLVVISQKQMFVICFLQLFIIPVFIALIEFFLKR